MENEVKIIEKLNEAIAEGISASTLQGFEKAFVLAESTRKLESSLTKEFMMPIMSLAGNKLGFKTDKDTSGGYPVEIVRKCLIEAVLTGVNVVGNQFNIIAGNCYITKEGFGCLLKNVDGLNYTITPGLPRVNKDNTSGAVEMHINWEINGQSHEKKIEFGVKVNKYIGIDGIIGKATRKARKWLYEAVTGMEIGDGDVQDISYVDVSNSNNVSNLELGKKITEIEFSKLIDELNNYIISYNSAQKKYKGYEFSDTQKNQLKEAGTITPGKLDDIIKIIIDEEKPLSYFEFFLTKGQIEIVNNAVIDSREKKQG